MDTAEVLCSLQHAAFALSSLPVDTKPTHFTRASAFKMNAVQNDGALSALLDLKHASSTSLEEFTRERSGSVAVQPRNYNSEAVPKGTTKDCNLVGSYNREQRREKIKLFIEKRLKRTWQKRIKYDVRKDFADSRLRVRGRFVRKCDEDHLRELLVMMA